MVRDGDRFGDALAFPTSLTALPLLAVSPGSESQRRPLEIERAHSSRTGPLEREPQRYLDRADDGRGGEEVQLEERERRAHQLDREIAEMDRARLRILADKEAAKSEQSREEAILRQLRAARDAADQQTKQEQLAHDLRMQVLADQRKEAEAQIERARQQLAGLTGFQQSYPPQWPSRATATASAQVPLVAMTRVPAPVALANPATVVAPLSVGLAQQAYTGPGPPLLLPPPLPPPSPVVAVSFPAPRPAPGTPGAMFAVPGPPRPQAQPPPPLPDVDQIIASLNWRKIVQRDLAAPPWPAPPPGTLSHQAGSVQFGPPPQLPSGVVTSNPWQPPPWLPPASMVLNPAGVAAPQQQLLPPPQLPPVSPAAGDQWMLQQTLQYSADDARVAAMQAEMDEIRNRRATLASELGQPALATVGSPMRELLHCRSSLSSTSTRCPSRLHRCQCPRPDISRPEECTTTLQQHGLVHLRSCQRLK